VEGLGTKSLIASRVYEELGVDRYDVVAYDSVAAIVNDLCCVGALPLVVNAYFATGNSAWYEDTDRAESLLAGWRRGCDDAGATWGGGESPSLPGLLRDEEIEIAGSAVGVVPTGQEPLFGSALAPGDEIVVLRSTGLHANGATLARSVASDLPDRYGSRLSTGETYGRALLEETPIYVPLVAELQRREIPITYLSHITGHGLLKLMRPPVPLTYRLHTLPDVPPVLQFIVEHARLSTRAAYSTLNMGAGFAVYCKQGNSAAVIESAQRLGHIAFVAGQVEEGPRQVILEPIEVRYDTREMQISLSDSPTRP
jgi:phosphoribosylformylglycinamidine cyclo-ligase